MALEEDIPDYPWALHFQVCLAFSTPVHAGIELRAFIHSGSALIIPGEQSS